MDHSLEQIRPSDQPARERALDIHCSFIVEAPAGSGKTGLLMQRFLKLLADAEIEKPEEVVAITFTRKATAEMRLRILQSLQAADRNHPLERNDVFEQTTRQLAQRVLHRSQASGWNLLEQPQRLNIRTIDSVCAEIARSLPILSGMGGTLEPVEDAGVLYQEAARRTLQQLDSRKNTSLQKALETVLLHRDGNLRDCEMLIAEMLRLRDQWARLLGTLISFGRPLSDEELEANVRPRLEEALRECIESTLHKAVLYFPAHALKEACRLTHHAAHVLVSLGGESKLQAWVDRTDVVAATYNDLPAWRALSHQLLTDGNWRKPSGVNRRNGFEPKSTELDDFRRLLEALCGNEPLRATLQEIQGLPDPEYPDEQWQVAKALFHLLQDGLIQLQLVFAQTQQCDFTEIALAAQSALEDENGISGFTKATGLRIQHLLIDEMQDTSVSQYELIRHLTEGWDGYSQTLFLVGDPKQSIYLFRQARVELFQKLSQEGLGSIHLNPLQLTANFRSQALLVEQLNNDFAQLFPSHAEKEARVTFTEATPIRRPAAYPVTWHVQTSAPVQEAQAEEPLQAETQQYVQQILEMIREHHHGTSNGNAARPPIAILARARTHLAPVARALRADGEISFRAVDIELLGEVQEVQDALALTRALLHPADRVAWLSLLRSPVCGLTLAEIYCIANNEETSKKQLTIPELIQERSHLLSPPAQLRATALLTVMEGAQHMRNHLSLPQWIERTWNKLGWPYCLDKQQMQNTFAYFALLEECELECHHNEMPISADMILQKLTGLYANPEPSSAPVVELMTIHRAKGLEWEIVIVPELQRAPRYNTQPLFSWMELPSVADGTDQADTLALLAPIHGKGESSSRLTRWINQLQMQREAEELQRVFYVACTRAREELHLFATAQESKSGFRLNNRSLLKTIWPVAEKHFAALKLNSEKQLLHFPKQQESVRNAAIVETLAAVAEPSTKLLRRLPLSFFDGGRSENTISPAPPGTNENRRSLRKTPVQPPSADLARSFGNAAHAFLEQLAITLAQGAEAEDVLAEISTWESRVAAFYRAEGFAPPQITLLTSRTQNLLRKALQHPIGRWILQPHHQSACEVPMQSHTSDQGASQLKSIRIDRIFQAGNEVLSSEGSCWWIVDYKTSEPGEESIKDFLQREQSAYREQLEGYAKAIRMQHGADSTIHLALYYPSIAELIWWKDENEVFTPHNERGSGIRQ